MIRVKFYIGKVQFYPSDASGAVAKLIQLLQIAGSNHVGCLEYFLETSMVGGL